MHFADGSATTNAVMPQVGRTHPVQLKQKGLWIPQTPGRGEMGLVSGRPQAPHQPGLRPSLKGSEQGKGSDAFQVLAETTAGQQQGHRTGSGSIEV
jgi:hypothetical protein